MKKIYRKERVTLMFTTEEFDFIQLEAQKLGFTNISEFIRVMIFNGLKSFGQTFLESQEEVKIEE
jgi:hypothetical protein